MRWGKAGQARLTRRSLTYGVALGDCDIAWPVWVAQTVDAGVVVLLKISKALSLEG